MGNFNFLILVHPL